jgi:hypothetical protein
MILASQSPASIENFHTNVFLVILARKNSLRPLRWNATIPWNSFTHESASNLRFDCPVWLSTEMRDCALDVTRFESLTHHPDRLRVTEIGCLLVHPFFSFRPIGFPFAKRSSHSSRWGVTIEDAGILDVGPGQS